MYTGLPKSFKCPTAKPSSRNLCLNLFKSIFVSGKPCLRRSPDCFKSSPLVSTLLSCLQLRNKEPPSLLSSRFSSRERNAPGACVSQYSSRGSQRSRHTLMQEFFQGELVHKVKPTPLKHKTSKQPQHVTVGSGYRF